MTTPAAPATFPMDAIPDRPDFVLRLDGRDAPASLALDVLEIDVSEEVNRHGRAALLLRNWDADTRQVRYSDGLVLAAGVEIEISLGWRGKLSTVFTGVITGATARFGETAPTIEVACRTRSSLLAAVPRARVYENVTDGDVAGDIASRYGLSVAAGEGISQPQIAFAGQSDWDWLVHRAGQLGWVTYVRGTELVFGPAARPGDSGDDELTLEYGTTLRELRLTEDLAGRADPVTVSGWSPADLESVTADAGSQRAEPESDGRPVPADALGRAGWPLRERTIATAGDIPADEADRRAVAAASTEVLRRLSGTGRTLGLPRLAADGWLRITGIGDRLGGRHYVSAVRHRLGRRGYTTEFQLGYPRPLLPSPRGDVPAGAGGVGGLLLGVVTDLDDPLGWGRVKVAFPWLDQALEPVWARLVTLDAGPSQGTWFVPDIGQEVLVGHIGDDHCFPVMLGALWNGRQVPPERMDARTNEIKSVVTRSGHRLTFDDHEPGAVSLKTAGGHKLVLDDDGGTITLTEKGGAASITLGQDGVSIVAQQGDITLSAPAGAVKLAASRLSSKASGPATVESAASLELKATGSLSVSGAIVRIN
ncbi:phage baseplate assembly protein V [Streptosporangium sp. NBC_01755]|uniref:phage baseplate assembly protein V n=1 Tax=Streptosporangium sp. NBC_01755 TaxID=2975949 RepID=UPI002DDBBFD9|nr:phage baseplate assembly protein V [Streptosporangium sp. NBC_01755]WSD01108.1 phage baseplate assembly protein V [Streptosporangium sp. NBC_01755]